MTLSEFCPQHIKDRAEQYMHLCEFQFGNFQSFNDRLQKELDDCENSDERNEVRQKFAEEQQYYQKQLQYKQIAVPVSKSFSSSYAKRLENLSSSQVVFTKSGLTELSYEEIQQTVIEELIIQQKIDMHHFLALLSESAKNKDPKLMQVGKQLDSIRQKQSLCAAQFRQIPCNKENRALVQKLKKTNQINQQISAKYEQLMHLLSGQMVFVHPVLCKKLSEIYDFSTSTFKENEFLYKMFKNAENLLDDDADLLFIRFALVLDCFHAQFSDNYSIQQLEKNIFQQMPFVDFRKQYKIARDILDLKFPYKSLETEFSDNQYSIYMKNKVRNLFVKQIQEWDYDEEQMLKLSIHEFDRFYDELVQKLSVLDENELEYVVQQIQNNEPMKLQSFGDTLVIGGQEWSIREGTFVEAEEVDRSASGTKKRYSQELYESKLEGEKQQKQEEERRKAAEAEELAEEEKLDGSILSLLHSKHNEHVQIRIAEPEVSMLSSQVESREFSENPYIRRKDFKSYYISSGSQANQSGVSISYRGGGTLLNLKVSDLL